MRRENWTTRLAESSRVGVAATSDGGACPVFSVDLLKLMRADETTEEAQARLYQLRKQHGIKIKAGKCKLSLAQRQSRVQAAQKELKTSRDLLTTGDIRKHDMLKLEAKLLAANNSLAQAQETEQAALDELEAITLLGREDFR